MRESRPPIGVASPRAGRARAGARAGRGFTLIELAAVVLVIALLYGFVLPNFGIGSRRALDGDVETLRATLELARQRTIATGARHRVALDLDQGRFRLESFVTPPAPPEKLRDERGNIDLTPPRPPEGSFLPLYNRMGRTQALKRGIYFARVETAEGVQERGTVGVEFLQDGTASAALIALVNDDGDALELEVLPLADTVRVRVP